MKRIHKYELPINGGIKTICDPIEKVLDIQCQGSFPVMWAEVDLDKESKSMDIIAIGTGWEYEADEVGEYLGTAQDGYGYVWHYFVYKPLEMEKAPTEKE